jgi:radical SAM superfamily enzyme YgiQ (UPF0313 family)
MKEVFLMQPVDLKFIPLGLMKFSSYYKKLGYNIYLYRGRDYFNLVKPDIICIDMGYLSTSFKKSINITKGIIKRYSNINPFILVGGIQATINYDSIKSWEKNNLDIHIIQGELDYIKKIIPDYTLFDLDWQYTFTTKGCIRNCPYCYVNKIHPNYIEVKDWETTIDLTKGNKIQFGDDNFLACSQEHFDNTINKIKKLDLIVDWNQALDIRLINEYKIKKLSEIKLRPYLRFSLDSSRNIPIWEKKIKIVLKYFKPSKVVTYCLIGYDETFKEDYNRIMKVWEYKVRPFAMKYLSEDKPNQPQIINDLARWSSIPPIFKTVTLKEYRKKRVK